MQYPITVDLLIDNQEIKTKEYADVIDPGKFDAPVGRIAQATPTQVDEAVVAAHRAFTQWRDTPLNERSAKIRAIASIIEDQRESITQVLVREQGMLPFFVSREIKECAHIIDGLIKTAETYLKPDIYEDNNSKAVVHKRPWGVIAAIVPWNAPVILTMGKVIPALLAGNTVVVKPSPNAPLGVSLLLKEIANHLPAGTINVVHGDTASAAALTSHPLVRKISFTGGGPTATHIMSAAAKTIKGVQLELGGNDPALILDDADPTAVAHELLNSAFGRSGQFCFATKRMYVADSIYEEFVDALRAKAAEYKVGHPTHPEATFGPVNNRGQFDHVAGMIERARELGARVYEVGEVLEPGTWETGFYRKPTIIADADHRMDVVVDEQFGPVIPVVKISSDQEAIELANATEFGLSSSVWSADTQRAIRVADRLECGRTYINAHRAIGVGLSNMPFGGVKQSGLGWEHGSYGLAEYIEYHSVNYGKQA